MEYGPIQLIVIAFDDNEHFQGHIARELDSVRSRGVIRLIDALAITKSKDGDVYALQESDFTGEESAQLGSAIREMIGLDGTGPDGAGDTADTDDLLEAGIGITAEDIQAAADELEPGTSALYLLIEHVWATGLKHAVRAAGGYPVVQGFLTPEVVMMIGAEVEAIVEAEATIELAEAVKGAAILDALITMEIAEEVATEAVREAAQVVDAMAAIRAAAAAEAVRALIVAELIEEAAAEEAAQALVQAGLIEDAALEAATASAAEAEAEVAAMR